MWNITRSTMSNHLHHHVLVPPVVAALAIGAVIGLPVLAADPALAAATDRPTTRVSAPRPGSPSDGTRAATGVDFTAGVRSIAHGAGIVTLTNSVPTGTSVEVSGDVVEPVWAEGDAAGHWEAQVRVRPGQHVIRVTSQVSGQAVDIPVELLILLPPDMLATVDGIARTIDLAGSGHPGAHLVVRADGTTRAETDVAEDGTWHVLLRDLAFGSHHVEVSQYFDGTRNGGVDDVYEISGAPTVERAQASRQTERITLAGRAPAGSTLTFEDARGPVTGPDGQPVEIRVGDDTSWQVTLPIPDDVRFDVVTVIAHDGGHELGRTDAHVTIPLALTGSVEELDDGRIRLSGTGEVGGTVTLEDESGAELRAADGKPLRTGIGRSWELVVPRHDLPAGSVVARQRVQDVEQGALRLVLPGLPDRPGAGHGSGTGTGASAGGGIVTGTDTRHPTAARVRSDAARPGTDGRLAYTGADIGRPTAAAVASLLSGAAGLPLAAFLRRRAASRR
ncbi:hypothetical protein DEJ25_02530 [Curtobacterium sp. MCPF17_011]|nr:hypothetical protein DEJ25_02530 [Curtobacterium sp. MCPF17_011]